MMLRDKSWLTDIGWATSTVEVGEIIQSTLAEGKTVKLHINSGGGLVSGTSNLADLIYENRENIETYATGMAASAAMWVFASGGKRYAEATTVLGSIGVVTSVYDDEELYKSFGVVYKEVTSNNAPNKRPDVKTEEGIAEVKRYLTELESVFLSSVSTSLGMTKEEVVTNFHKGGLITGEKALSLKVVDNLTSYNKLKLSLNTPDIGEINITKSEIKGSIMNIEEELKAAQTNLSVADDTIAQLEEKLEMATNNMKEMATTAETIMCMAFEHKVSKDTALEMLATGCEHKAATVALKSKTVGASIDNGAGDNISGEDNTSAKEEEAELEFALEIAKKLSI